VIGDALGRSQAPQTGFGSSAVTFAAAANDAAFDASNDFADRE